MCNQCAELQTRLKETEKQIKKLGRLISAVGDYAATTAEQGTAEMARGNVPQGRYAYLKAQHEIGNQILTMLGLNQVAKSNSPTLFGKGLFTGLFRR